MPVAPYINRDVAAGREDDQAEDRYPRPDAVSVLRDADADRGQIAGRQFLATILLARLSSPEFNAEIEDIVDEALQFARLDDDGTMGVLTGPAVGLTFSVSVEPGLRGSLPEST